MGAKPTADGHARLTPQDEAPVRSDRKSLASSKWFDVAKGYGFIIPDNGMPDVLLHVTCPGRDGFQTRTKARESSSRCRTVRRACRLFAFPLH